MKGLVFAIGRFGRSLLSPLDDGAFVERNLGSVDH